MLHFLWDLRAVLSFSFTQAAHLFTLSFSLPTFVPFPSSSSSPRSAHPQSPRPFVHSLIVTYYTTTRPLRFVALTETLTTTWKPQFVCQNRGPEPHALSTGRRPRRSSRVATDLAIASEIKPADLLGRARASREGDFSPRLSHQARQAYGARVPFKRAEQECHVKMVVQKYHAKMAEGGGTEVPSRKMVLFSSELPVPQTKVPIARWAVYTSTIQRWR